MKNAVLMTDLIVDKLVFKDVQLTATNDDQYFVFEDMLYQVNLENVSDSINIFIQRINAPKICNILIHDSLPFQKIMLCFSRDTEINQFIQQDFANLSKSKQYEGPPCGIVPFHGICMFGMLMMKSKLQLFLVLIFYLTFSEKFSMFRDKQQPHFAIFLIHLNRYTSHSVHSIFGIVIV